MIDEGILDGDLIIIEDTNQASNGDLVVATVDEEATVKRIYFHKNIKSEASIELRPANPTMVSIWLKPSQLLIRGKVKSLIRKF